MSIFTDLAMMSRIQFAFIVIVHFMYVPLSVGLGLILAIVETQYYRNRTPENAATAKFWLKIFTATFTLGVATGITMEFSFGTNWADYSRFVGDIFGAPLAAEALFAFFLESVFLGILIFGRKRVSPKFYCISAWLVWFGSALSALWILIANSWMQTPAGAEVNADGTRAILTNFFAAAFNPSTLARYSHTVLSLIVMGAFFVLAVAGFYMLKKRHEKFAHSMARLGCIVGVVSIALLLVSAHATAVGVSEEQPTKLAAMEGMYEDEVPPLYLFGYVDEESQETIAPFAILGGTSFLATGQWDSEFQGLNSLSETEKYAALDPSEMPVNLVFQSYHLMVGLFGVMALVLLFVIIGLKKKNIGEKRWLQKLLIISPVFPLLSIQAGWITAEVGRQPWIVYPSTSGPEGIELLTNEAFSQAVTAPELMITLGLFIAIYTILIIGWARIIKKDIDRGPAIEGDMIACESKAMKEGE